MRIALISDIHGNATALKAVLGELAELAVDRIFCLGDIAADGPNPSECIAILNEKRIPSVQGNTDAFLVNSQTPHFLDERRQRYHEIALWSAAELDASERDYLANLPARIAFPEAQALFYHGSPQNFEDLVLPTSSEVSLVKFFGAYNAKIFAGGHTHSLMLRAWGERQILTAGSVGLAAYRLPDGNTKPIPFAEYVLLDYQEMFVNLAFRRVRFDVAAFHRALREKAVPHADWLIARWQ
jgi:predicted phosphodiesterase